MDELKDVLKEGHPRFPAMVRASELMLQVCEQICERTAQEVSACVEDVLADVGRSRRLDDDDSDPAEEAFEAVLEAGDPLSCARAIMVRAYAIAWTGDADDSYELVRISTFFLGMHHAMAMKSLGLTPEQAAAVAGKKMIARAQAIRHSASRDDKAKVIDRYNALNPKPAKDAFAWAMTKDFAYEFSTIRGWLKGA